MVSVIDRWQVVEGSGSIEDLERVCYTGFGSESFVGSNVLSDRA